MDDNARYLAARQRVAALKGFYLHAAIYAVVIVGLAVLDASVGAGWWVQWPALGWGVAVALHAAFVFGQAPRAIADWEARKIKEILDDNRGA